MAAQPGRGLTAAPDLGLDHYPPEIRAAIEGWPRDLAEPTATEFEAIAGDYFEVFQRSREHRIIMTAARRAGRPYSWAERQWSDVADVAAEIGFDAYNAWVQDKACPHCGHDPDDVLDPLTHRVLDHGRIKVEKRGCEICATIGRRSRDIDQAERDMLGTYWTTTYRMPGEPFVDDGGFEFDDGGMSTRLDLDAGGFA